MNSNQLSEIEVKVCEILVASSDTQIFRCVKEQELALQEIGEVASKLKVRLGLVDKMSS